MTAALSTAIVGLASAVTALIWQFVHSRQHAAAPQHAAAAKTPPPAAKPPAG